MTLVVSLRPVRVTKTFRRDKGSAGEANCDRKLRESLISQGLAKGPLSVVFS